MKRKESGMQDRIPIPDFFVSTISEKQEATLFRKITLCQGATSSIGHTFCTVIMEQVINIDDIAFLESKNAFRAVR